VCWLRSFPGAVWYSGDDQTAGAVVCKPFDEVADLGRATFALVRFWRIIRDLPIPPPP
jgi:hypothetical protein